MTDLDQSAILRTLIEEGDVEALETFLVEQGVIDLSNFPGQPGWTPLAHSVLHQKKDMFRFLLRRNVDLEATISVPTLRPHTGVGTVQNRNILGFCVMAQPDFINYYEYAEILVDEGVRVRNPGMALTSQPIYLLSEKIHCLLRDADTIRLYFGNTPNHTWQRDFETATSLHQLMVVSEIARGHRDGAEMLTQIFCNENQFRAMFRRPNLLGKLILQLMQNGENINLDIYDFTRFPFDDTTRSIYDRLQRNQNERSLVFRAMEDPYNRFYHESPISTLPGDLRARILKESVSENLRRIQRDECGVCFNVRNLHQVCHNGHKLCGTCHAQMTGRGQFNCPICRTRMLDT